MEQVVLRSPRTDTFFSFMHQSAPMGRKLNLQIAPNRSGSSPKFQSSLFKRGVDVTNAVRPLETPTAVKMLYLLL